MFWAPHVTMPLGGSVAQHVEPNTSWFFDGIPAAAGDKVVERKAFEEASYGRQLGLITEVLLDLAKRLPPESDEVAKSVKRLSEISERIENLKNDDTVDTLGQIDSLVARLAKKDPAHVAEAIQRIDGGLKALAAKH
jgi:hypothetical protein